MTVDLAVCDHLSLKCSGMSVKFPFAIFKIVEI